jgi:hypothetical protein
MKPKASSRTMRGRFVRKAGPADVIIEDLEADLDAEELCAAKPSSRAGGSEYCLGLQTRLDRHEVAQILRDMASRLRDALDRRYHGGALSEEDNRILAGDFAAMVPPGGVITLSAMPQVPFKPAKVILDDRSATCFSIVDIKVGKNSQLIASGPLPGCGFTAAVPQDLKMDTAQIGMNACLSG